MNYDSLESLYGAPKVYAVIRLMNRTGRGNLSGKRTE